MKNVFFVMFSSIMLCCNMLIIKEIKKNHIKKKHQTIHGYWSLCKFSYDDLLTNYNVCSKVIFKENKMGLFVKPNRTEFPFEWEAINDSLLSVKSENSDGIDEGMYNLEFTEKENYCQLKLIKTEANLIYYLGKEPPCQP